MSGEFDAAAVELLDSRADHRWVLSAMAPAERRQLLERMGEWLQWLVVEYDHLELGTRIPPCWYRHRGGRNVLLALYVGWVRTYVEPTDSQRENALIEWDDALNRVAGRLKFAVECLENGEHVEPHTTREPWKVDDGFRVWLATDPMATAEADHPAPYYQTRPKAGPGGLPSAPPPRAPRLPAAPPSTSAPAEAPPAPSAAASPLAPYLPSALPVAEMQQRLADGSARPVEGVPGAVLFSGSWWLAAGDGAQFVRLDPSNPQHVDTIRQLDAARASLV
ncbi:hypothetical protein [Kitasatospora sp. NPDC001527]|uniref:hypothetical protein n=1 Tax=Kitasatospora sp. NPDC001527 TaxID=3154519 RepID=UPI003316A869